MIALSNSHAAPVMLTVVFRQILEQNQSINRVRRFARINPTLLLHSSPSIIEFFRSLTCGPTSSDNWSMHVVFGPPCSVYPGVRFQRRSSLASSFVLRRQRPVYLGLLSLMKIEMLILKCRQETLKAALRMYAKRFTINRNKKQNNLNLRCPSSK